MCSFTGLHTGPEKLCDLGFVYLFRKYCTICLTHSLSVAQIWKPRYFWILVLGGLIICASAAVFYYPGLRLPDTEEFQLFSASHSFERYDLRFKRLFGFEKEVKRDIRELKI